MKRRLRASAAALAPSPLRAAAASNICAGTVNDSVTALPVPSTSSDWIIAWISGFDPGLHLREAEEPADDVAKVVRGFDIARLAL